MSCMPKLKARLDVLPIVKINNMGTVPPLGHTVFYLTLGFASKMQAKKARARILEEQCRADGSPFAVGFASTFDIALI